MTEREQLDELKGRVTRATLVGHELIEFCHRVGVIVCSVSVGEAPGRWDVVYVDLTGESSTWRVGKDFLKRG